MDELLRMPDGTLLTEEMIDEFVREAEEGYDLARLHPRTIRSSFSTDDTSHRHESES